MTQAVFTMPNSRHDSSFDLRKTAFTLVELMVSLVILSILMSLALGGIMGARVRARISKTESTIRKISEIILPYYETYEIRRPVLPPEATSLSSRTDLSELRRTALRRIMTLELPDRTSDIGASPNFIPQGFSTRVGPKSTLVSLTEIPPVSRRYGAILSAQSPTAPNAESEDFLCMIVTRGPVADPDVTAHFRPDEYGDTNKNGLAEFIDGWGNPIKFKRWPIGFNSPLQPINGSLSGRDERVSKNGHRLVPLIYSAGVDQIFDIADVNVDFKNHAFDPFDPTVAQAASPKGTGYEVVMWPAVHGSGASAITTYIAVRANGSGYASKPLPPETNAAVSSSAYQTIGSERIVDDNSAIGSRDNIHNHNMTR